MKYYFINHKSNITIANIWVVGGTSLDKKDKKGINQILLLLLMRGCKNFNSFAFSDYLDSYGAELNYEAYEDGISICLKSLDKYFDDLYPLMNLVIEKPNLFKKEFNYCKNIAINNTIKLKENPFNITFDNLKKLIYCDHPYSYNNQGNLNSINNISYQDILNEYENFKLRDKFLLTNYKLNNFTDIKKLNKKYITNKLKNKVKLIKNNKRTFKANHTDTKQVIFMIGNQTCPFDCKDNLSLKILESYLSFGMSSLLFKIFRENNGLSYESGVFYPFRKDNAPFMIYLSVSNKEAISAYKLLIKIWDELINKLITNEELNLAKTKLKASFLHNFQTIEENINRKIKLISLGINPYIDKDFINDFEKISSEDILLVSKKYFKDIYMSISGNKNICDELNNLWKFRIKH